MTQIVVSVNFGGKCFDVNSGLPLPLSSLLFR